MAFLARVGIVGQLGVGSVLRRLSGRIRALRVVFFDASAFGPVAPSRLLGRHGMPRSMVVDEERLSHRLYGFIVIISF